jgi:hypothetical protein
MTATCDFGAETIVYLDQLKESLAGWHRPVDRCKFASSKGLRGLRH